MWDPLDEFGWCIPPSLELVVPIPNKSSSSTCVRRSRFFKLEILWSTMHIPPSFMFVSGLLKTWPIVWGDTPCSSLHNQPGTLVPSWRYLLQHQLHDGHNNHATHRNVHLGLPPWGNVVPFYNIHSFEFYLDMDLLDGTITWNWRLLKVFSKHHSNIIKSLMKKWEVCMTSKRLWVDPIYALVAL